MTERNDVFTEYLRRSYSDKGGGTGKIRRSGPCFTHSALSPLCRSYGISLYEPNMNRKTINIILVLFLGILCTFLVRMAFKRNDTVSPAAGFSAGAQAERILAEARVSANTKENVPVSYRTGLTTDSVRSEGAIMIVKNKEFEGISEDPQGMMDMLTDMSGSNKKKNPPVYLTDKDLDKKIVVELSGKPGAPLSASVVPEMGKSSSGGKAMISAPVDYKVFKDSETWQAFASTHKGRFPQADFSREAMLILVSVSDLPSGIFKIDSLRKSAKETAVLYRVDPLAMAAGSGANEQNFYSAVAVPKTIDIKLEQIP